MKLFPRVLSLAAIAAAGTAGTLHAQTLQPCGTDEVRQRLIAENPDILHQEAQSELGLQEYLQMKAGLRDDNDTVTYVIPIVFHILYDPTAGSDVHNISDAQVYDAVNILNRDYAKLNGDTSDICCGFEAIASRTRIQFQLATKDPFGNCTNGIDRITTQRSTDGADYSKLNPWFREKYLNIWVVRSLASQGSFAPAGYSFYPSDVQDALGALRDGVIILHDYIGAIGTGHVGSSRALTHEVGHYLNLKHTWGGTNAPEVACGDDNVGDTPVTKGHQSCNLFDSFCSWQAIDSAYQFTDVTTTSGTTDPTPVPTVHININDSTIGPALTMGPVSAVGVSANSSENGAFAFSLWGTGAQDGDSLYSQLTGALNSGRYYEFTVTPLTGKSMTLSSITFRVNRSADGPRTYAVRSNAGSNFTANLQASIVPGNPSLAIPTSNTFYFKYDTTGELIGSKVTLGGGSYVNSPEPITFRIYAWNAENPAGYFAIDSLVVNGNAGVIENVQNYMEYSYCSNMFTEGQAERMRGALNSNISARSNLWKESNHAFAGIAGHEATCGPQADFYPMRFFACVGAPIQFKDNSGRATPTTWAWAFDGGNPATSNEQNPTVSFDEPGARTVTLTVGNEYGSSTITKNFIVNIGPNYSETGGLLAESFDGGMNWPFINYENNNTWWHWDQQNGHYGPGCAMLNASGTYYLVQDAFSPDNFSDKDELVTPSQDLRFANNIKLKFWYAYAARTVSMDEVTETLKVYSSTDCGATWLLRETIAGGDLVTAGIRPAGYAPGAADWREATVDLPGILATNNVRFKFVYASGLNSNDIFLDDVNIVADNVGIAENSVSGALDLMPNPATNQLTVGIDLAGATTGTLSFLDMTGRELYSQAVGAGDHKVNFDLEQLGLTSGVYLVQLKHGKGQRVEKLVVR